ncbi:cytochrome c/c1 heme lyase-domain-containing protein [Absidia repens]|uniref:Holocytochrome c-type synthase n=1 Tax=Absidia repens TaxID=90262 RepID=A0A1X2IAE5_9FUNG|nr:cytochrome c/c1 heme lyase-domain-containing protein [Absidia repens]
MAETEAKKCPIDHTKMNESSMPPPPTRDNIKAEHATLSPVHDESKCPVDPSTYNYYDTSATTSSTTTAPAYTTYKHPMSESSSTNALADHARHVNSVDDESKCPVDPSAYKYFLPTGDDQQETVTASSYEHLLPKDKGNTAPATAASTAATAATPASGDDHHINSQTEHLPPQELTEGCASDTMNTSNYMPHISQQALPDQKGHLGKHREISTIPRANSEENLWVYPSEQMFFNAMRRKNWNPDESDMPVVVPIHNAVNEQAWQKILEWERLHVTECQQPKLLKFQGKPKEITPKARIRSWLGYNLPFDRHDWTVDRCGEKVTYVIDFYAGKQDPKKPQGVSFYLDVRPAVSPSGIWDRMRMAFKKGEFI